MATLGSGRIVFSPEPQENVMTTAMIVTEAPYNDEESENRINMTENIMNKTETIFSSNSSHLTTSDNNIEVNQSYGESLQVQLYTIATVFGVLYFLIILMLICLSIYIWRLHKMLSRNRMKNSAVSRSNGGILSYENGGYEESAYIQRENERCVDPPLGRNYPEQNGNGQYRGMAYRISVDDTQNFENPDFDGGSSDLSSGSVQRNISRILGNPERQSSYKVDEDKY